MTVNTLDVYIMKAYKDIFETEEMYIDFIWSLREEEMAKIDRRSKANIKEKRKAEASHERAMAFISED